jgi:hypothetical protein
MKGWGRERGRVLGVGVVENNGWMEVNREEER